jgi:hypothetical protein
MADIATLAIKVENGDVPKATASLDALTVAGTKSEAAAQRLTRRMALLEIEARGMDAAMGKSSLSFVHIAESMGLGEVAAVKLMKTLGALGGLAVVGLIGHKMIEESIAAQNAMAQLEAAVKSTGGVAGRTAEQLDVLSRKLAEQSTFSHVAVAGAESLLLTFDKIRGVNFDRATQAVADLATRMGGDLHGAALQVGKALQDPEHGLTALRRAGVSFSASQIEVIKDLYETGRVAEGQTVILKELEHQFGGSAAAARDTLGGALTGLKHAWGDLFEVSKGASHGMIDAINAIADAIPKVRAALEGFVTYATIGFNDLVAVNKALIAVLEFQQDLVTQGISGARKALSERLTSIEEVRRAENARARSTADADTAAADASKKYATDLSETLRKFIALRSEREAELGKLAALNGAYGKSALSLTILGLQYDAMIQKSKDAAEHHGAQLTALNKLTDAILKQKIAQAELADQQARTDRLRATQRGDADAVRAAKEQLELAKAAAQQANEYTILTGDLAARRRIDLTRENELLKARLDFADATKRATEEQVATAQLEYESNVKRINQTHDLARATLDVVDASARVQEARHQFASFFEDVLTNGTNAFTTLFDTIKRGFIKLIADLAAQKITTKLAGTFGGLLIPGGAGAQGYAENGFGFGGGGSSNGVAAGAGALGGLGVGYGVGAAGNGSAAQGALGGLFGGAATGALTGAALGGPFGAAIGGAVGALTGLVGGILGAGKAAHDAAVHMAELQKSLGTAIEALRAEVAGDSLGQSIAQANAERQQLIKQAEDAYAGGGANSDQVRKRAAAEAEINSLEDQRIAKLREEDALRRDQAAEDLRVEILRNNGSAEAADALALQLQRERQLAELRKQGIDEALLAELAASQAAKDAADAKAKADAAAIEAANQLKAAAEAAAAAAEKAAQQQQALEDLNVELLRAKGQGGAADDLAFQLEQQRRLEDAQKNQTQDYVDKLKELQQLQRDQRAAQQLIDSTGGGGGGGSGAAARGATQALTAVSSVVTDRTALMLVDLTRSQVTYLEKIEQNTRGGGSGGRGGNTFYLRFDIASNLTRSESRALAEELVEDMSELLSDNAVTAARSRWNT